MSENRQSNTNNSLIETEDIKWVLNKKSKLLLPQRKKPTGFEVKTLWDKMNLFGTLAIPIIIALATIGFGLLQLHLADVQHQQDQQQALDQQQAATLQIYLDDIQDLLLNHNLLKSKPDDDVAILARARTLTALQGLDQERKGRLLLFLHEADLIGFEDINGKIHDRIIELITADFSNIYLDKANLSGANLDGVTFYNAYLGGADLSGAHLSGVNLNVADLNSAELSYANISYSYLNNAYLNNAYLNNADLSETSLVGADLSGANLNQANLGGDDLSGATITQQQLNQVRTCRGAILSKGLTCKNQ